MTTNVELGRLGEALAAQYYEAGDCEILDRNWRCWLGEIDLVVRDRGQLVCVEVKTRRSLRSGHPLEAITATKLQRMRLVASEWAATNSQYRGFLRLDVLSIVLSDQLEPEFTCVKGVG